MSRGIRPLGVPDNAFRIRVGQDTTIADLVCSLSQQHEHECVSFDFGGKLSQPVHLTFPSQFRRLRRYE